MFQANPRHRTELRHTNLEILTGALVGCPRPDHAPCRACFDSSVQIDVYCYVGGEWTLPKNSLQSTQKVLQDSAEKSASKHFGDQKISMDDGKEEANDLKAACVNGLVLAAAVYCDEGCVRTQQMISFVFRPWRTWFSVQSKELRSVEETHSWCRARIDGDIMLPVIECANNLLDANKLGMWLCD